MAKSEIPSIVVQSRGSPSSNGSANSDMEHQPNRPTCLAKQDQFDAEDRDCVPSPVMIQIEGGGGGHQITIDQGGGENEGRFETADDGTSSDGDGPQRSRSVKSGSRYSPVPQNGKTEKAKPRSSYQRVKLLVRSQAVHDDTSPPPDPDIVSTNANMLSVTCALFSSQTKVSNKHQLVRQGSSQGSTQGSMEGSSPSLSRDSSTETYMESTGIDIQQFIIDTLHKNQKDRMMLLKIEQELTNLVKDNKRQSFKFPQMSSYNRMLVHRVAAFFYLDHYVDQNGTAVIVNKTKTTRLPDIKFREQIRDELVPDEPKKSILKRDSASFEEGKELSLPALLQQKSPERQLDTDDRHSKSFEEREEEYGKVRARIFNQDSSSSQEGLGESPLCRSQEGTHSSSRRSSQEDIRWASEPRPWSSTDSDSSGRPHLQPGMKSTCSSFEFESGPLPTSRSSAPFTVLSKTDSSESKGLLVPTRGARPVITKASSFGGISVPSHDMMVKSHTPRITKAESFNVTTLSSTYSTSNLPATSITVSPSEPVSSPSPHFCQLTVPPVVEAPSASVYQSPVSESRQTFPIIVGQQHSLPPSQVSSQTTSNWQTTTREPSVITDLPSPQINHPTAWPGMDSIPAGSVLLSPQTGTHYVNVDGTVYRQRQPSNISGQTVMVAPFQAVPAPATVQIAPQISHQQQQQQQQRSVMAQPSFQQPFQSQTSVQPTIVYVPYVAPQLQTQMPSQTPSMPQLAHQQSLASDQRQLSLEGNNSNMGDLVTQLSILSFVPASATGQPSARDIGVPGNARTMETSTSSLVPHGYVIPVKSQVPGGHQASVAQQLPVYYVPQIPQSSTLPPLRYVYPATSVVQTPVQQSPSSPNVGMGIGNQGMGDLPAHMPSQSNTQQMAGSPYMNTYPMLGYSHGGDVTGNISSPYLNYTVSSQSGVSAVTSTSSGLSIPLYPHSNIVLSNIASGAQVLASPPVSQTGQPPNYVSPVALNAPSGALPMYIVTSSAASPVTVTTPHVGSGMGSTPYVPYRVQTPPTQPANGTGPNAANISLGSPFVSYALYTPTHSQHMAVPPNVNNNVHSVLPSNQFQPGFLSTFQVIRPGIPLVSSVRNSTPPPPPPPTAPAQNLIPSQFSTPPPPGNVKRQMSFPVMKASDINVRDLNIGAGNRQDQKGRTAPLHVSGPTGLICRRGLSLMQDMCLLGHPLQHQMNPLMLPQQRPLARFPHPASGPNASVSNRPPKLRKQRSKGGNNIGSVGRTAASNVQHSCGNVSSNPSNHILEIEGIPEGMKRCEIERYLEQVTNHGAKIQFISLDGGVISPGTDLTVNTKYKVLAVFESDTAAQSALLNIKTAKFQLRQRKGWINEKS